eukprot:TRINITY_DN3505_c0_g2_i1.p1 TRINITY_DN3505_c0_g2~~TRINITY_DN3505_c0_g2_i1.p1  ORF type:complete len:122 (-),score=16.60 TRINITY_DN3505_c0_g2_i1:11-376(-)
MYFLVFVVLIFDGFVQESLNDVIASTPALIKAGITGQGLIDKLMYHADNIGGGYTKIDWVNSHDQEDTEGMYCFVTRMRVSQKSFFSMLRNRIFEPYFNTSALINYQIILEYFSFLFFVSA